MEANKHKISNLGNYMIDECFDLIQIIQNDEACKLSLFLIVFVLREKNRPSVCSNLLRQH